MNASNVPSFNNIIFNTMSPFCMQRFGILKGTKTLQKTKPEYYRALSIV